MIAPITATRCTLLSAVPVDALALGASALLPGRGTSVSVGDVGTIAALVSTESALASLRPAWKAARIEPVTALGHV